MTRDLKKEHEKFLKKMGVRKLTRNEFKQTRKAANRGGLKSGYAERYYSKDQESKAIPKFSNEVIKQRNLEEESESVRKEILRKEELIRAINMPRPADLSDDCPERMIDQKHLISK